MGFDEASVRKDTALAMAARDGDQQAAALLFQRLRPSVLRCTRGRWLPGADRNDLVQEAYVGLAKAIRDFHPERGVPFRAFADMCMKRSVVTALRSATRMKHRPLTDSERLHDPEVERRSASDIASDPSTSVEARIVATEATRSATALMTDLEATCLRLVSSGASYDAIAERLGCAPKSVDNAVQRARRKVRAAFASAHGRALGRGCARIQ